MGAGSSDRPSRNLRDGCSRPARPFFGQLFLLTTLFVPATLFVQDLHAQEYAASLISRHVLTNDGVITLAKAGFDELFIVERIRTSRAKFDTSIEGLVALKQAGLSEDVIRLIAQRDNQEYRASARLSYYAPPANLGGTAGVSQVQEAVAAQPAASRTPTITEKHWWVFRWIRVSP